MFSSKTKDTLGKSAQQRPENQLSNTFVASAPKATLPTTSATTTTTITNGSNSENVGHPNKSKVSMVTVVEILSGAGEIQ